MEPNWRKLSDKEIEKQYDCSKWVRRIKPEEVLDDHLSTLTKASNQSRAEVSHERLVYGPGEEQKIYVFGADELSKDAPILVFIHGGYWQCLSLEVSCHLGKNFYDQGLIVASVGYDLCPKVTFEEVVEQTRKAVSKILEIANNRGSRGVFVCGSSAGGHLTALMLATDWSEYGVDGRILKGGAPLSGIFDVRPFCRISFNASVGLDEETAWKFSPLRLVEETKRLDNAKIIKVIVAEFDSPEFIRQSEEYARELSANGINADFEIIEGLDHFTASEDLKDSTSRPTKAIMEMIEEMGMTP